MVTIERCEIRAGGTDQKSTAGSVLERREHSPELDPARPRVAPLAPCFLAHLPRIPNKPEHFSGPKKIPFYFGPKLAAQAWPVKGFIMLQLVFALGWDFFLFFIFALNRCPNPVC